MQHGRFRAPDPGDPARGPATGDEGEEGPTHGEDGADESELLPVHRLSNLIGAKGEAQETDDQSDGQRGERPNPYGAPGHRPADPFRIAIVHESPPGSGEYHHVLQTVRWAGPGPLWRASPALRRYGGNAGTGVGDEE